MKRKILFFILLSVCVTTTGQNVRQMTLDSCLHYAYAHNITLLDGTLPRKLPTSTPSKP